MTHIEILYRRKINMTNAESGKLNPMDSLNIQNGMIQKILLMVNNYL